MQGPETSKLYKAITLINGFWLGAVTFVGVSYSAFLAIVLLNKYLQSGEWLEDFLNHLPPIVFWVFIFLMGATANIFVARFFFKRVYSKRTVTTLLAFSLSVSLLFSVLTLSFFTV